MQLVMWWRHCFRIRFSECAFVHVRRHHCRREKKLRAQSQIRDCYCALSRRFASPELLWISTRPVGLVMPIVQWSRRRNPCASVSFSSCARSGCSSRVYRDGGRQSVHVWGKAHLLTVSFCVPSVHVRQSNSAKLPTGRIIFDSQKQRIESNLG